MGKYKLIKKILDEEFELAKKRSLTRIKRKLRDGNQPSARTKMKLKFKNRIAPKILTGEEIKGEENTPIEVALVDDPTEKVVDDGPEASASVEIVLLKGEADATERDDWTVEEFNEKIVAEVEGKRPLLAGNVPLKLQRGVGIVENIKFRNHASKVRPPVFKLGARLVGGVRVKEAKTESFTVKDYRYKYYKKHKTPLLSDKVPRLVNIRKGGKIDKCLQENKIHTVEDFLIRLRIDPQGLRSIVNLGEKKWEATVKNAQACTSDSKMYCYINLEQKAGVVFNVFGQVLGLYSEGHYSPTSLLSENHKACAQQLLPSAYKNWGDVKFFDDMDSLQQYFTGLNACMDTPNSLNPEMVGESSSRRSNISFNSESSTLNSFSTEDVEIMHDAFMLLSPGSPFDPCSMFQDFDELIGRNDICNVQLNGLVNEQNAADEQCVATVDVAFDQSKVVQTSSISPKRWKKLFCVFCVSRWFSIRKKVSVDVSGDG